MSGALTSKSDLPRYTPTTSNIVIRTKDLRFQAAQQERLQGLNRPSREDHLSNRQRKREYNEDQEREGKRRPRKGQTRQEGERQSCPIKYSLLSNSLHHTLFARFIG